jgi:hypothetical protein
MLCTTACSEQSTRGPAREDAAVVDTLPFAATLPCEPTLPSIRESIFAVTCAFEYCHGASAAAGLWLLDPDTNRELVGAPSADCPGWALVEPGAPEHSLLWQKLSSDHPPCRTERMPYGKARLPPAALECVRGWIEGLAERGDGSLR